MRSRRGRLLLGLAAIVLVASGCRMQLDVNVTMEEDGAGVVEVVVGLDEDGIERIGGDLEAVMRVDDLLAAGWTIDGPTLEEDGFTRVRIRHPFADPDEANEVLAQIAGEDGPFQDFRVAREQSATATEWDFRGDVDFGGGLEAFSDEGVAAELDGLPLGQTVEEIEEELGDSIDRLLRIRVGVQLPGEVTSNATTQASNGAVWQVQFGGNPLELQAHGEERRTAVLVAAGVAAAAVLILLVFGLVRLAMRVTDRPSP